MGKYIVFQMQQQDFALAIEQVDKILIFEPPTRIPDTQPTFMGLKIYEGEQLPVIDMSKRLFEIDLSPGPDTKIIVVHWKGKKIGLAVDGVSAVKDFAEGMQEEIQEEQAHTRYIKKIFRQDNNIILQLDTEEILSEAAGKEILTILEK